MDILHCDLETVETSCFWDLNFLREALNKIFIHNTIAGSKKGQNVGNKMFFIVLQKQHINYK